MEAVAWDMVVSIMAYTIIRLVLALCIVGCPHGHRAWQSVGIPRRRALVVRQLAVKVLISRVSLISGSYGSKRIEVLALSLQMQGTAVSF